tara:strand:- start:320 stop:787 length:468 start_codon:yes stop_codon:yes gene_type:complete
MRKEKNMPKIKNPHALELFIVNKISGLNKILDAGGLTPKEESLIKRDITRFEKDLGNIMKNFSMKKYETGGVVNSSLSTKLGSLANKVETKLKSAKDKIMKKKGAVKKKMNMGGAMMKKKGYAKGGAMMKKKGYARGGAMMKKKGYARGGATKRR